VRRAIAAAGQEQPCGHRQRTDHGTDLVKVSVYSEPAAPVAALAKESSVSLAGPRIALPRSFGDAAHPIPDNPLTDIEASWF
jgi:hypothetical protein